MGDSECFKAKIHQMHQHDYFPAQMRTVKQRCFAVIPAIIQTNPNGKTSEKFQQAYVINFEHIGYIHKRYPPNNPQMSINLEEEN